MKPQEICHDSLNKGYINRQLHSQHATAHHTAERFDSLPEYIKQTVNFNS
jgi:hypothetical protein